MPEQSPPGFGRRLRAAARPSLGLALTAVGVLVAVVAIVSSRSGDDNDRAAGPPVRECRIETVRATVARQAKARETVTRRRPISATASATAKEALAQGGGSVAVRASATARRTLVVTARVPAVGRGSVTVPARARACARASDRSEAGFRASLRAKRRAQAKAKRLGAPRALAAARQDASRRARESGGRQAQSRLDSAAAEQQPELEQEAKDDARLKARAGAQSRALTSP